MLEINDIKERLNSRAEEVARHLLPNGRLRGHEFEVGSLAGEKGQSLRIHVKGEKTGLWSDFAAGASGDLIDLWMRVRGHAGLGPALEEIKSYLGVQAPVFAGDKLRKKKTFATPKEDVGVEVMSVRNVAAYLSKKRGLSAATLAAYKVAASPGIRFPVRSDGETTWEKRAAIVFPSYRDGRLLAHKYIALDLDARGKKLVAVAANCEPCLFGWQAVPDGAREIVITEGEIDAMSMYQLGYPALSVPFGGGGGDKQRWIEYEFDNLTRFEKIYLALDMDDEGEVASALIAERLGAHRCYFVKLPRKDANECLMAGLDLEREIRDAQTRDPGELRNATEFMEEAVKVLSGELGASGFQLPWPRHAGKLAFRRGEVTIWTGINGHGKSIILGFFMLHGAKTCQEKVCIASMEMRPARTLARMTRQATALKRPSEAYIEKVFEWFGEWCWLFDLVGRAKVDRLLDVFLYARRRYGCTQFVVDSLAKCGLNEDDYNGQKELVERLCDFANEHNVHVHLVTHARKRENEFAPPGKMDVKGSGGIVDMGFNLLTVWRNKKKEDILKRVESGDEREDAANAPDAVLVCDKQRNGDWEGKIGLWYDLESYQYLESSSSAPKRFVEFSTAEGYSASPPSVVPVSDDDLAESPI